MADQGYPLVAYERIQDNEVMFQVLSDGTIVLQNGVTISSGNGSPEGVVTAPISSLYMQKNGAANMQLFQKQTGSGNTGWAVVGGGGGGGTPGGVDTSVQFNTTGTFDGNNVFTYDPTNGLQIDPVPGTPMSNGVNALIDGFDAPASTMIGGLFSAGANNNTGVVSITEFYGLDGEASAGGGAAEVDVTNMIGVRSLVSAGALAVVDTMIGLEVVPATQPGAAVTTYYGLHIPDPASLTISGVARAIQVDGGISQFGNIRLHGGVIDANGNVITINGPTANNLTLDVNQIDLQDVSGNGLTIDSSINLATFRSAGGAQIVMGTVLACSKDIDLKDPATTAAAGHIRIGATHATTVGAAGGADALPAAPVGYLIINVEGTEMKIPYYNT